MLEDLFKRTANIIPNGSITTVTASASQILRQKYNETAAKIKRLYNLYASSGDELLLETIKENQAELSSLSRQIDDEEKNRGTAANLAEQIYRLRNLQEQWDSFTMKEKQQALSVCISKVIIDGSMIDIQYRF